MASPRGVSAADRSRGPWLSLGPASRVVGVDPDTLRRWADEGRVACFVTPGGHRRFSRATLERLIRDGSRAGASLAGLGATPERVAAAYRRRYAVRPRSRGTRARTIPDPLGVVAPADRSIFRDEGRRLVSALLRHLDTPDGSSGGPMDEAIALVDALGTRLGRTGVGLVDAVSLFVAARQPFLAELGAVGRRRSLGPEQLGRLFERASAALDILLVAFVRSHGRSSGERA